MMHRLAMSVLIAAALAGRGEAAQVDAALSVAQDDPARLDLSIWPSDGWAVRQFENLVEIRFPGSEIGIIQQGDLIDRLRGRVSDIQSEITDGDTYLRITLACDCRVSLQGDGVSSLELSISGEVADPIGGVGTGLAEANAGETAPVMAPRPAPKPSSEPAPVVANEREIDAERAREILLAQLMQAAEAGLVDLGPELSPDADPDAESDPDAEQQDPAAEQSAGPAAGEEEPVATEPVGAQQAPAEEPAPERAANEQAATEAESSESEMADAGDVTEPPFEATCFPGEVFTLPDLVTEEEFLEEMAGLNARLVGEFDRPDAEVAIELAKLYLSVGIGLEARAILADFAKDHPDAPLFDELAQLLIGEVLPAEAHLRRPDCMGEQALWRAHAAAMEGDHAAAMAAEANAGRALERLPLYPREMVASTIGLSAVEVGDWDTARRLEAMGKRAAFGLGETSGPLLRLSSKLAEWHGETDVAKRLLRRALESDPETSDTVLFELAERALRSEEDLGADTAELRDRLGAMALRDRGTEQGARAFELEARLNARVLTRDDTIAMLSAGVEAGLYPAHLHVGLLSELATSSGMQELSRPLGLIYLEDPDRFAPALQQVGFRRAVVHSLAELGVPALSGSIIQSGDLDDEATAIALAESFLQVGQPREAIEIAQGLPDGPERDRILGEALIANGQINLAQRHLPSPEGRKSETEIAALAALREHITGALENGDIEAALTAAERLLAAAPDVATAEQAAMLALDAGRREMPAAAAEVLAELAPERQAAIALLFAPVPQGEDATDPKAVAEYLDRLEAEISTIEGMLGDG